MGSVVGGDLGRIVDVGLDLSTGGLSSVAQGRGWFGSTRDAAGNLIGGLTGGGKSTDTGSLDQVVGRALNREEMANMNLANVGQEQLDFGKALANGALGKGPSLAEAQLRQAQDRGLAQQLAAVRSQRGASPGLQARMLQQSAAQQNQQLAGQSAIARLQEQRQQQAQFQDYLSNQQNYQTGLLNSASGAAQGQAAARSADRNRQDNMMGGLLNTGATLGAAFLMSDKNVKREIKNVMSDKAKQKQTIKKPDVAPRSKPEKAETTEPVKEYIPLLNKGGAVPTYSNGGEVGWEMPSTDTRYKVAVGNSADPDAFNRALQQHMAGMKEKGSMLNDKQAAAIVGALKDSPADAPTGLVDAPNSMTFETSPFMVANSGGKVPGRAAVSGDSPKNDFVKALLSPGEVVVPRSVVKRGKDAAGEFVEKAVRPSKADREQTNPRSFLDALTAYQYEYKDPKHGKGMQLGIMAQDLQKHPVGRQMVEQTSEGLAVNSAKGFGALLAATADMHKRLSEIETKYKKRS